MRHGQAAVIVIVLLVAIVGIVLLFSGMTGRVAWSTACVKIGQQCKALVLGKIDDCRAQCVNKAGVRRPSFDECVDACLQDMLETCAGNCNPRCLSLEPVVQPFSAGRCNNEML